MYIINKMRVLYTAAAAAAVYNIRIMYQNTQVRGLEEVPRSFRYCL